MQEAQTNLTQAIQILTNFCTKVIQNDFARLESETTANESKLYTLLTSSLGKWGTVVQAGANVTLEE